MNPKIQVVFQPFGKQSEFISGVLIYDALIKIGLDISSLCGGKGRCGKCKVIIRRGIENLDSPTEKELEYLSKEELGANIRLACQTRLNASTEIFVPSSSQTNTHKLQPEGTEFPIKPFPLVKKYYVLVPNPNLPDLRSDEKRVLDSLKEQYNLSNLIMNIKVRKELPSIFREAKGSITVVIWKNEIISIQIGDTSAKCFGVAFDVGTTKLVGFLVDLNTGKVLSNSSEVNPQIRFGEDIISRITYVLNGGRGALRKLQEAVIAGINEIINNCCKKATVRNNEIYEATFVGNTAMHHFLLGLWPESLAYFPYSPVILKGVDIKASKIGVKICENSNAHFLPIIGGFVGADHVAAILASKMIDSKELMMVIDIGTNTEVSLGNKDLIMACSCASGPAFEGMSTRFGMRASSGAIEHIQIDKDTLEVSYQIIGNVNPIGVCGSGFVDALAELVKSGIISKRGSFNYKLSCRTGRLRKGQNGWEFVIAWKCKTNLETDIVVTQSDIREIQKAKAAIHAGVVILLNKMKVAEIEIGNIVISGAFGNYIDVQNARFIGMFPGFLIEKILFKGNLAGIGARMALVSKDYRDYAEKISKKVVYYELANDKDFQNKYIKSLELPVV